MTTEQLNNLVDPITKEQSDSGLIGSVLNVASVVLGAFVAHRAVSMICAVLQAEFLTYCKGDFMSVISDLSECEIKLKEAHDYYYKTDFANDDAAIEIAIDKLNDLRDEYKELLSSFVNSLSEQLELLSRFTKTHLELDTCVISGYSLVPEVITDGLIAQLESFEASLID